MSLSSFQVVGIQRKDIYDEKYMTNDQTVFTKISKKYPFKTSCNDLIDVKWPLPFYSEGPFSNLGVTGFV